MTTLDGTPFNNIITLKDNPNEIYCFSFIPDLPKDQPNLIIRHLDGATYNYRISLLNLSNNEKTEIDNTLVQDVEQLVFEIFQNQHASLCSKPTDSLSNMKIQPSEAYPGKFDIHSTFASMRDIRSPTENACALKALNNLLANQPIEEHKNSHNYRPEFPSDPFPQNTNENEITVMTYNTGSGLSDYKLGAAGWHKPDVHNFIKDTTLIDKDNEILSLRYKIASQHVATVLSTNPPDIIFLQEANYDRDNQPKPFLKFFLNGNEYGNFTYHQADNEKSLMKTVVLYKKASFIAENEGIPIDLSKEFYEKNPLETYAVGTLVHRHTNTKLFVGSAHFAGFRYPKTKEEKVAQDAIEPGNKECDQFLKTVDEFAKQHKVDNILIGCDLNADPTTVPSRFEYFTNKQYSSYTTAAPTALNTKDHWEQLNTDRTNGLIQAKSKYPHMERHLDHFFFKQNRTSKNATTTLTMIEKSPFGTEQFPLWNPSDHNPIAMKITFPDPAEQKADEKCIIS